MKIKIPEAGGVVQSVRGRDCGSYYVIIEAQQDFVWVIDGTKKRQDNPKKKNLKHVRLLPLNVFGEGIVKDGAFENRVAHYLKGLADKVKSED